MRQLARDRRGVAAIEFAAMAPFLCVAFVGFLDVVYIGRGHLRTHAAATQVGQIISQCKSVSGGDKTEIANLAGRALLPLSNPGRPWAVIVTAIRLDTQGKPSVKWTMDSQTPVQGKAPEFKPKGPTLPADVTLKPDEVMFRTEVFVEIDATLFSGANTLLASFMKTQIHISKAHSSVLHMGRSPDADKLNTNASTEACLS